MALSPRQAAGLTRRQGHSLRWGGACWPRAVSSDIRRDFVARGLYAAQLRHYLLFLPRVRVRVLSGWWVEGCSSSFCSATLPFLFTFSQDRILVVHDADLRSNPGAVLRRVQDHIGLPEEILHNVTDRELKRRCAACVCVCVCVCVFLPP
jgi:hypothetical protein